MSISVQALDAVYGHAAAGVPARLDRADNDGWTTLTEGETDVRGYLGDWISQTHKPDLYRVAFNNDHYFAGLGATTAYPEIIIVFRIPDETRSYQIQVLLSPNSYSTYFGAVD
jgi:5-hydroxyisourate hydrolase